MIIVQQQVKPKLMIPHILILKLKVHSMNKHTQEGSIIVTDQPEVVGVDEVEVVSIEAPQKNLIVRETQLAEMKDRPDVIFVSPFFTGQLIAQTNLLINHPRIRKLFMSNCSLRVLNNVFLSKLCQKH